MGEENLNKETYSLDIRSLHTQHYKNLELIPTKEAQREFLKLELDISDCKEILEKGYIAPRKRKKDKEEKWLDKGKKTYNIVIVKSYDTIRKQNVYLIVHVGKFTKKKVWPVHVVI